VHSSSRKINRGRLLAGTAVVSLAVALGTVSALAGDNFDIPAQPLPKALAQFGAQSGFEIIADSMLTASKTSPGVSGNVDPDAALSRMLRGTGLTYRRDDGSYVILAAPSPRRLAEGAPARAAASVETVVVTSSKIKGNIQTVPIAITALSQEQLTARQIAGGPDLVKEVPNLTFTKTNFTGYSIQIRGIGTQAISVTTDPAVAVAFNDTPFIRNHFFEQEFYDVSQVEVLRGPQGTLYGRNATAGVVNVISAKPTDQFEAMLSADWGNYLNRRYEGMVNIPIVDDRLDLRVAGEWTKRDGYVFNETSGQQTDGRDLWSGRVTLGWKPVENVQAYAVWEHFSENDDRLRSAKQLCNKDPGATSVDGLPISSLPYPGADHRLDQPASFTQSFVQTWLSQGCLPVSLYDKGDPSHGYYGAFGTPNGKIFPFVELGMFLNGDLILNDVDPYANQNQSTDLRVIQSLVKPHYRAMNDTLEFNVDWAVTPSLTVTSQTGYNKDFLYSTEDLNRFDAAPGIFSSNFATAPDWNGSDPLQPDNQTYCDPQLGCSQSMVGQDISQEHAWQLSQELRLASNFSGPFNFSVGANYMHYQTIEDYYILSNLITAQIQEFDGQDAGQYAYCNSGSIFGSPSLISPEPLYTSFASYKHTAWPSPLGCNGVALPGTRALGTYIDSNPLGSLNGQGHNYFRSENPYKLNSYAGFGEAYYQVAPDLKLTGGLRWTDDQKTFWNIPSWVFETEWTGRFVADWTPKLDFTDQTLVYASYSRGYKGGGANPPGPINDFSSAQTSATHPLTFAPEFINAYELGTKNTLLDGGLTLNGDVFYYDYKGYQISQIVDRTSINLNFDATVKGAELEASYEPIPGLKFNFAGGYEDTRVNNGQSAIDLMDRTAGHNDWMVVRPYVEEPANCILPAAAVRQILQVDDFPNILGGGLSTACDAAYVPGGIAVLFAGDNYEDKAAFAAAGFDPSDPQLNKEINNGEGFAKNLGGNELPNAPHFTTSLGADYTIPVSEDWAATLHSDFYWQSQSFARIFNDRPYDKIRGYSNVNLALILTSASGWQVMGYLKNVFDTTAITGDFLFSDDTALTTNVFVTDPRLFGVRVTKNW